MNLIDLVSETHQMLRQQAADQWFREGNEPVSQGESHLLSRISDLPRSISEVARLTGVSRQATHRTAMNLQSAGYLELRTHPENRRDKFLHLTPRGRRFVDHSEEMKKRMENRLEHRFGVESIRQMKRMLAEITESENQQD